MVLRGALFRLTSIKLIYWQQNSDLGNNWATKIGKKVELGNKKEKETYQQTQQIQALNKQKKDNYFPIQKRLNIVPNISRSISISPVIDAICVIACFKSKANNSELIFCCKPFKTSVSDF